MSEDQLAKKEEVWESPDTKWPPNMAEAELHA
jgi:hypothetical protein